MGSTPMGYTACDNCRGRGRADDEAPCPSCEGTGLVAVRPKTERRRFPRYRADLPIKVRNRLERDLEGHCTVISEGGLSVTLLEAIAAGSVVLLPVRSSNSPDPASCVGCGPPPNWPPTWSGVCIHHRRGATFGPAVLQRAGSPVDQRSADELAIALRGELEMRARGC